LAWKDIFSWNSVGWWVALLVGIWGILMGTADYVLANILFSLVTLVLVAKWGHATRIHTTRRSTGYFLLGTGVLIVALITVLSWTSGKFREATRQRNLMSQLYQIPALKSQVDKIPALQAQIDSLRGQNSDATGKINAKQDTIERLSRALAGQLGTAETKLSANIDQYRTDTSTAVAKIIRPGRTFTPVQRSSLLKRLQDYGPHEVAITPARGNQECLDFANAIESVFTEAHWHIVRTMANAFIIKDGTDLSIIVRGANDEHLTADEKAVAIAFNSIGMPLKGDVRPDFKGPQVELYVGLQ
jgi:hypothetical protein